MKATSLSAGAVPFRKNSEDQYEFLLLRAFKNWDFPKGMVEVDEDPWAAALREVEEETGLTFFSFPCEKEFTETEPYGKNKIARYYILKIEDNKKVSLAPNPLTGIIEHHEFRWMSFDEATLLVVPRVKNVLDWAKSKLSS